MELHFYYVCSDYINFLKNFEKENVGYTNAENSTM